MADLLSAISVLLVFLTFLLTSIEKEVSDKTSQRKPEKAQTQNRKNFNNELLRLLFMKVAPVTLMYCITFYSLLPKAIHIVTTSTFHIWDFNELNTIFLFIEIGLLGLTAFAITKFSQLIKKIRDKV